MLILHFCYISFDYVSPKLSVLIYFTGNYYLIATGVVVKLIQYMCNILIVEYLYFEFVVLFLKR